MALEWSEAARVAIIQFDHARASVNNGGSGRRASSAPFGNDGGIGSVDCRVLLGDIDGKVGSGRSEGIVPGGAGAEVAGAFLVSGFEVELESVSSLSRGGQDSPGLDIVLEKFGFFKGDEEKVHDRFVT